MAERKDIRASILGTEDSTLIVVLVWNNQLERCQRIAQFKRFEQYKFEVYWQLASAIGIVYL